jgi:hypothetical protein
MHSVMLQVQHLLQEHFSLPQERGEMRTVADVAAAVVKARSAQTRAI